MPLPDLETPPDSATMKPSSPVEPDKIKRLTDELRDRVAILYEKYEKPWYRHARTLSGDEEIAKDIVHNAVIKVIKRDSVFDRDDLELKGLVFMKIRSLITDYYRSSGYKLHEDDDGSALSVEPSRDDQAQDVEEQEQVRYLLDHLPKLERAVIVLKLLGNNQVEIANELDLSEATVSRLIRRALVRLRAILAHEAL